MNDSNVKKVKKLDRKISKLEAHKNKLERQTWCFAIIAVAAYIINTRAITEIDKEIEELEGKKEE